MHKTVYLAGPIDGLSYAEGIEWRQHAQQTLAVNGIKGLSPQRGKEYIAKYIEIAGEMDFAKQEHLFNRDVRAKHRPAQPLCTTPQIPVELAAQFPCTRTCIREPAATLSEKPNTSHSQPITLITMTLLIN